MIVVDLEDRHAASGLQRGRVHEGTPGQLDGVHAAVGIALGGELKCAVDSVTIHAESHTRARCSRHVPHNRAAAAA